MPNTSPQDGEFKYGYRASIGEGSDEQYIYVSGRLESEDALKTLQEVLEKAFAVTPKSATCNVLVRGLEEASDSALWILSKALRDRCVIAGIKLHRIAGENCTLEYPVEV